MCRMSMRLCRPTALASAFKCSASPRGSSACAPAGSRPRTAARPGARASAARSRGADQRIEPDQTMTAPLQPRHLRRAARRGSPRSQPSEMSSTTGPPRSTRRPHRWWNSAAPRRCACRPTSRAPRATPRPPPRRGAGARSCRVMRVRRVENRNASTRRAARAARARSAGACASSAPSSR